MPQDRLREAIFCPKLQATVGIASLRQAQGRLCSAPRNDASWAGGEGGFPPSPPSNRLGLFYPQGPEVQGDISRVLVAFDPVREAEHVGHGVEHDRRNILHDHPLHVLDQS
jgi:hypothetical protein